MTTPESSEGPRHRAHVFGYCGPAGAADGAWSHAVRAAQLRPIVGLERDAETRAGRAAFGLIDGAGPGVAAATLENGSFLVLDGEFQEDGAASATASSALDGFLNSGRGHLERIRFTGLLAAWDAPAGRMVVLRDRYGIAPAYLARLGRGTAFASRVDTLIRAGVKPAVDAVALGHFLTFGYFPAPSSPITGVVKVPPGHVVDVVDGVMGEPQLWARVPSEEPPIPAEEAAPVLRDHLIQALERCAWRGRAGLLLSGGVDSAMLLAGLRRMLDADVHAFTFRYLGYRGRLNEGSQARAIADHMGASHLEIPISPDDLWSDLGGATAAYGEPPNRGLHSYRLSPLVEHGITTLFSGAGPDGWSIGRRYAAALRFRRLPAPLRRLARVAAPALERALHDRAGNMRWVMRETADIAEAFYPGRLGGHDLSDLYRDPEMAARQREHALHLLREAAEPYHGMSPERALTLLDKRFITAEAVLFWNTAWARAHGLALRLPYFDVDLVEAAMRIRGHRTGKDVLRLLALDHYPRHIASAPKIAQEMPVSEWIRGPLAGRVRSRLDDLPSAMSEILDDRGVTRLVDEHAAGRADHGWTIIALLAVAAWCEWIAEAAADTHSVI